MFTENHYKSDDGLQLYYRIYGPLEDQTGSKAASVPVICLPGLTRNSKDFHKLAVFLSNQSSIKHQIISVDYRGRGQSDYDTNIANYNIVREAKDVIHLLDHLNIDKANFIGTSRGGLILLILATMKLDVIQKAVFNDIGPELDLNGLLDIKNYLNSDTAPTSLAQAANLQQQIHGAQFPNLTDQDWLDMADNMYKEVDGSIVGDFDRAIAGLFNAIEANTELPDMWEQYALLKNLPTMSIRGGNSTLFTKDIQATMASKSHAHTQILVKDAGHPPILHLDGLEQKIANFLSAK